jgi:hypothetical protein
MQGWKSKDGRMLLRLNEGSTVVIEGSLGFVYAHLLSILLVCPPEHAASSSAVVGSRLLSLRSLSFSV